MSNRFRFIDIVRPIMGILPEVEAPLKKVSILALYMIMNIVNVQ